MSSIYKLTKEHLDCQGPLRQKVSLAAQLLSHGVSSALTFYRGDDIEYSVFAEFIELLTTGSML